MVCYRGSTLWRTDKEAPTGVLTQKYRLCTIAVMPTGVLTQKRWLCTNMEVPTGVLTQKYRLRTNGEVPIVIQSRNLDCVPMRECPRAYGHRSLDCVPTRKPSPMYQPVFVVRFCVFRHQEFLSYVIASPSLDSPRLAQQPPKSCWISPLLTQGRGGVGRAKLTLSLCSYLLFTFN